MTRVSSALWESARAALGEGVLGKVVKAGEYSIDALGGPLNAFDADVVHAQWLPFAWADARLLGRLRKRVALVHTVHNAQAFHGDATAAVQGRGYISLLPSFDALIVHGEATRAALEGRGIDLNRVHLVPHPPMKLAAATPADLAAVPPKTPNVPRIAFFGTIRPYKGLDLLIEAAINLWKDGHNFELAIAGKPFMPVEALFGRVRGASFAHRLITDLEFSPRRSPRCASLASRYHCLSVPLDRFQRCLPVRARLWRGHGDERCRYVQRTEGSRCCALPGR